MAELWCPATGIGLEMTTSMEGMQLYTAGWLTERKGKGGAVLRSGPRCLSGDAAFSQRGELPSVPVADPAQGRDAATVGRLSASLHDKKMTWRKRTVLKKHCPQRVEKAFSPPRGAGIHRRPSRFPCALRPEIGAFLETGSLSPPLAAHRPFPLLGFPAHTLPYRYGGFTTLSTVSGRKYTPSAQLGSEPAADLLLRGQLAGLGVDDVASDGNIGGHKGMVAQQVHGLRHGVLHAVEARSHASKSMPQ